MEFTFSAADDVSAILSFAAGDTISFGLAGEFTGTVVLERTEFPGSGLWLQVGSLSSAASSTFVNEDKPRWYRLRCTAIGEKETITATLALGSKVLWEIRDGNSRVIAYITEAGFVGALTGNVTGNVVGSLTGTHTGNAVIDALVCSADAQTATGAVPAVSFVDLDHATVAIEATVVPTKGQLLVVTQKDAGTVGHTLTTAGTFDGINNTATFDAQLETLVLFAITSTRWVILGNFGSVGLSAVA